MIQIKSAEIISVGTELLLGQIVNTNASWLAGQLTLLGISSYYQTVVGDNHSRLLSTFEQAGSRADLLVVTGGLGPTSDDITMEVVSRLTGRKLAEHKPSRDAIAAMFERMGRKNVTPNNWKQALMPEDSLALPNSNGTAPGCIIEYSCEDGHKAIVLLPGPPSEMKPMFEDHVKPWLIERTATRLKHYFIRMIGIGESAAETLLYDLIENQTNPSLAPYASEGEVMFRLTQLLDHEEMMPADEVKLQNTLELIQSRAGEYIYEIGQRKMPEVVKDLLLAKNKTISFAESCTAGLVSSMLGDYPGVSSVFKGSVIAYDNSIKRNLLYVDQSILESEGAVSEACALAMATGCRNVMNTDIAVAVTGIAGPDGGSLEKPVGLVWLAVADEKGATAKRLQIAGNRGRIRRVAALNAFDLARRQLL